MKVQKPTRDRNPPKPLEMIDNPRNLQNPPGRCPGRGAGPENTKQLAKHCSAVQCSAVQCSATEKTFAGKKIPFCILNHKQAQHEGVRYGCNQCDYKAPYNGQLTKHKQDQHEGVRFGCDQCEYKATIKGHLARHKRPSWNTYKREKAVPAWMSYSSK
jgi:hypothetical protein